MRTFLLCLVALLPTATMADEVFLKSGGRLSGRIVSETADKVEVDVGAGRIAVPTSSVTRIERGVSALQEYESRAGRLAPGDVEGWLALGEWASAKGLGSQAREAYNRARTASPTDARANEALGNVQVNGRWVSEDEAYEARGYVRFEGEWITPAERDSIERERAEDSRKEHEARMAEARAREAEAAAQEADARAREAEAAQDSSEGIPLWYAWGGGPAYWPRPTQPIARPSRPATPRAVPK